MFYYNVLRSNTIFRWFNAIVITAILTGIIFLWVNSLNDYPDRYQHSPDLYCVNCERKMDMKDPSTGQPSCCSYGTQIQYDCVTHQKCRQIEQTRKQSDEQWNQVGSGLIICGSILQLVIILWMYQLYQKELERSNHAGRRIESLLTEINNSERSFDARGERQTNKEFADNRQTCSICLLQQDSYLSLDLRKSCPHVEYMKPKPLEQQLNELILKDIKMGQKWQISESVAVKMNNGLKELDLTSKDAIKLTQKNMVAFSKLKLSNLAELKLQNNRIKDQGLSALCQNEYPSLQKISLDDNAITISGVKHILFNKWKAETKVSLYAVESVEHGYQLNVGESIPLMKKIIEKNNANQMDSLISANKSKSLAAINLLLITPLDEESPKEMSAKSIAIEERYRQQSSKNPLSLATVMLQLKQSMGNSLHFSKTPDIKSKLTSKIIFTGMAGQRVKFSIKFKHLDNFTFSDFKDNHKKLQQFEKWYFQYLRKNYGVDTNEMTLETVIQGSIKAVTSDNSANMGKNTKFFDLIQDSIQGFFENLSLTENEFDERGNYSFPPMGNAQIQERGGFPYYQPVLGKRFGIKIKDLYDKSNNDWLMMNGNKNEWAVVFHGVNYPTKDTMRSIMDGRRKGTMLRAGDRQACQKSVCLRSGEPVGNGIYVSPYFLTSLLEYSHIRPGQKFHVVLQCRAKPNSIKISSVKPDYCLINNSSDLRPYGVILFTDSEIKELSSKCRSAQDAHKSIYRGQQFTKQSWKGKYQKNYDNFCKR